MLLVAHELSVVRHMSDRVAVMYLGRIVEMGSEFDIFERPGHPYTLALLAAVPEPVPDQEASAPLAGDIPSPLDRPSGCHFHTRCPRAEPRCRVTGAVSQRSCVTATATLVLLYRCTRCEDVMIELKSAAEIERMRTTGQFVAQVLSELGELADVGVNLLDLEHHVRDQIRRRGAQSCYWDYSPSFGKGPFRNVVCLSVNDAVLHGLPHDYALRDGDVLSMDLAVGIDGWVADSARTVIVGTPADDDLRLVRATEEALTAGIDAARPGNRLGDVSAAIEAVATGYGYPINTEFGGHGLGRTMHEDPHVPNKGRAGRGLRLRAGMTLALEPWLARTTDRIVFDPDGWTIRSADGSRTAHSEHTVAITDDGPLVLTAA